MTPVPRLPRWAAGAILALFCLGALPRAVILARPPVEGDERIFAALVEQLESGRGYTLRGHPILEKPWLAREVYDRPLFHHPPGGILLFWAFERGFGRAGWALAQLAGYALFFAGLVLAARRLDAGPRQLVLVSILAATTPLAAFAQSWFWLDGPAAGLVSIAAALFLGAARAGSGRAALLAGLVLGAASWVRAPTLLAAPGIVAVAAAAPGVRRGRAFAADALRFAVTAALVQAPWALWYWRACAASGPLPQQALAEVNSYLRGVSTRGAWSYLVLLPLAAPSLMTSAVAWLAMSRDSAVRRMGAALWFWLGSVVLAHAGLLAFGCYAILRYVLFALPAAVLLAGLVTAAAWSPGPPRGGLSLRGRSLLRWACALGLALEASQGLLVLFVRHYRNFTFFSVF